MSNARLTPTAYLILGLLAREGPSTPYALERHVAAPLGNFWSFPHTLLYKEPPRLAALGLVTEAREPEGRRRRVLVITPAGTEALTAWLERPAPAHSEAGGLRGRRSPRATWRCVRSGLANRRALAGCDAADGHPLRACGRRVLDEGRRQPWGGPLIR